MKFAVVAACLLVAVFAQQTRPTGPAPSFTPCQVCNYIVSQAEHHLRRGPIDQGTLEIALLEECETLRRFQGNDAVAHCITLINTNIQTIFTDVQAHKDVNTICGDIKQC